MKKTDHKTKRIDLRISSQKKEELKNRAKKEGYENLSKYIITAINNLDKQRKQIQNPINEKSTSYHLSRIGNNLNQISYNLNKLYKSQKIDNKILKEISEELMYMNIQISELLLQKSQI